MRVEVAAGRLGSGRLLVTALERLAARGLLVATGTTTVVLPREMALHLRGGHVRLEVIPPSLTTTDRGVGLVDRTAAGSAVP